MPFTAKERRFINDYSPNLGNRPPGIDLATVIERLITATATPLVVSVAGANPYVEETSAVYAVVASFEFPGTDNWIVPTKITADVHRNGGTSMDIRIFDDENNVQIAQLLGITETVPTIKDLGDLLNLPKGPARWEVQMRQVGGGTARFASVSVKP